MRNLYFSFLFFLFTTQLFAQSTASFEAFELPLDTFLNNAEGIGSYQSGEAIFPNLYNPDFGGYWQSGWAVSTMRDDSTGDFTNLYSAKPAQGFQSPTYAVGQQNSIIHLSDNARGKIINGLYLTNTTYAYGSMQNEDEFAKKFGGATGNDPDFFKLTIQKYANGQLQTQVVDFYLADYRFEDNDQDYIVDDWQWVDLSNLGNVDSLLFTLNSSDVGDNGINTPLFFCMDNLEISNEISTSLMDLHQEKIAVTVFPNPTVATLQIEIEGMEWQGIAQVFDLNGRQLLVQNLSIFDKQLDVSVLRSGEYILHVKTEEGIGFSRAFVKE